jgi:hypothetical protein
MALEHLGNDLAGTPANSSALCFSSSTNLVTLIVPFYSERHHVEVGLARGSARGLAVHVTVLVVLDALVVGAVVGPGYSVTI